jgi:hypothetical protein
MRSRPIAQITETTKDHGVIRMVSKVLDWLESAAEADASMRCRSPSRRFAKSTDFTAGLYGKIIRNTFTVICCACASTRALRRSQSSALPSSDLCRATPGTTGARWKTGALARPRFTFLRSVSGVIFRRVKTSGWHCCILTTSGHSHPLLKITAAVAPPPPKSL